jgi:hypothetical protein
LLPFFTVSIEPPPFPHPPFSRSESPINEISGGTTFAGGKFGTVSLIGG